MLSSLKLKNFTAFAEAEFRFAPGLNVIVGDNSTGKTHILKLAYTLLYTLTRRPNEIHAAGLTKSYLQPAIANKLVGVFKPDALGRLTRREGRGRHRAEVSCVFGQVDGQLEFNFNTASKSEVNIDCAPHEWLQKLPVYLPTRELLTIYPGFVSLYETTHLQFDDTWRDTCILLGAPLARGARAEHVRELLTPLEREMGGVVELTDTGQFYLNMNGVKMEMHLVAEGYRKLAMIARLIATGALEGEGCLFWDEPEANLNPRNIKLVARTLLHLCNLGIQVFVTSHSLFLLRELDILLNCNYFLDVHRQFFGLHRKNGGTFVEQGSSVDDIGDIDALREELSQSDRYLGWEGD